MMSLQCGSRAVVIVDSPSWQGPLGLYTLQWRLVIMYESETLSLYTLQFQRRKIKHEEGSHLPIIFTVISVITKQLINH